MGINQIFFQILSVTISKTGIFNILLLKIPQNPSKDIELSSSSIYSQLLLFYRIQEIYYNP